VERLVQGRRYLCLRDFRNGDQAGSREPGGKKRRMKVGGTPLGTLRCRGATSVTIRHVGEGTQAEENHRNNLPTQAPEGASIALDGKMRALLNTGIQERNWYASGTWRRRKYLSADPRGDVESRFGKREEAASNSLVGPHSRIETDSKGGVRSK